MATVLLTETPWPVGATVKVFAHNGEAPRNAQGPPGAMTLATLTVGADSTVLITALDATFFRTFWAVGQDVDGVWRWVAFVPDAEAAVVDPGIVIIGTPADGDILIFNAGDDAWEPGPPVDASVQGWQLLGPYLRPGWVAPVNSSITDLADDFCPRFYKDRDRVFLGGVVKLTRAALGGFADYKIFEGISVPYRPGRQQDLGPVFEDGYWNDPTAMWGPRPAFVWQTGLYVSTGGGGDLIPNGTVISLDGLSYRVSAT